MNNRAKVVRLILRECENELIALPITNQQIDKFVMDYFANNGFIIGEYSQEHEVLLKWRPLVSICDMLNPKHSY